MARRCAFLGMLVGAFAQGPEDGYSREQLQPLTNFRLCDFAVFLEKRSHSRDFPRQQHRRTIAPTLSFSVKPSICQTSLPQLAPPSRCLQVSLRMAGCVRRLLYKTVAATPVALMLPIRQAKMVGLGKQGPKDSKECGFMLPLIDDNPFWCYVEAQVRSTQISLLGTSSHMRWLLPAAGWRCLQ